MYKKVYKVPLKWHYDPTHKGTHLYIDDYMRHFNIGEAAEFTLKYIDSGKYVRPSNEAFDKGSDFKGHISVKAAGFTLCNKPHTPQEFIEQVHSNEFYYCDFSKDYSSLTVYAMNKQEFFEFISLFVPNGHKADKSKHPAMIMYLENKIKEGH